MFCCAAPPITLKRVRKEERKRERERRRGRGSRNGMKDGKWEGGMQANARQRKVERKRERKRGRVNKSGVMLLVGWLLNVPATCECVSGTDLLRQFYVLPH